MYWRWFCRRFHNLLGGYHWSEHEEILHAELVEAEKETAILRLYMHNSQIRHRMLTRMLNEELEANADRTRQGPSR
jgi:hypothetical protein